MAVQNGFSAAATSGNAVQASEEIDFNRLKKVYCREIKGMGVGPMAGASKMHVQDEYLELHATKDNKWQFIRDVRVLNPEKKEFMQVVSVHDDLAGAMAAEKKYVDEKMGKTALDKLSSKLLQAMHMSSIKQLDKNTGNPETAYLSRVERALYKNSMGVSAGQKLTQH